VAIIDTTATQPSPQLAGAIWDQLEAVSSKGVVEVFFPEVVVQETVRHYQRSSRKRISEAIRALRDSLAVLGDLIDWPPLDVRSLREQATVRAELFDSEIRRMIEKRGWRIRPLPRTAHADLLAWTIADRLPFRETGEGYRDALIWCTVLELATRVRPPSELLVFISDNTRDFGSPASLPNELRADLDAVAPELTFLRYSRIGDWLDDMAPLLDRATEEANASASLAPFNITTEERIRDAVVGMLDGLLGARIAGVENLVSVPHELQSPAFYNIEGADEDVVWDPYDYLQGEIELGRASVAADVTLEGLISKDSFYALPKGSGVEVLDTEWNEQTMWVSITRRLALNFHVRVAADRKTIEDVEFEELADT
jgi:hypothetical protein